MTATKPKRIRVLTASQEIELSAREWRLLVAFRKNQDEMQNTAILVLEDVAKKLPRSSGSPLRLVIGGRK